MRRLLMAWLFPWRAVAALRTADILAHQFRYAEAPAEFDAYWAARKRLGGCEYCA